MLDHRIRLLGRQVFILLLFILLLSGCAPAQTAVLPLATEPSAGGTGPVVSTAVEGQSEVLPTTAATQPARPAGLSLPALKFFLVDRYGQPNPDIGIFYCDPDQYPVARSEEPSAEKALPQITADPAAYSAIVTRLGLPADPNVLTAAQKVEIYRAYKVLNAIRLEPSGDGYRFDVTYTAPNGAFTRATGMISTAGQLSDLTETPAQKHGCPICLAAGVLIDTPAGPVAVQDLQPGMWVWSVDVSGRRAAQRVARTGSLPSLPGQEIVRVVLADGRMLSASAGHPLPDGRLLGSLALGERLDGAEVSSIERLPYSGPATYDLLPAGPTGWYWANGILLASTLR